MTFTMPYIQDAVEQVDLNDRQRELARQIIGRGGKLRANKPKNGEAAYIWRLVAFMISPNPQHHCMPCTVDFDIPGSAYASYPQEHSFQRRSAFIKQEMNPIINAIVDQISPDQQHGVWRWARAFGVV